MKKEYINPTVQLHELRHKSQILQASNPRRVVNLQEGLDGWVLDPDGIEDLEEDR